MSASRCILVIITTLTLQIHAAENPDVESPEIIRDARERIERDFSRPSISSMTQAQKLSVLAKYAHLDPKREVPTGLLQDTILFFDANKASIPNQNYITVIDFRLRSDNYRIFMVNMVTGAVEKFHTTHGVGSDKNSDAWAETFLNVVNSGATSLGFALTTDPYFGTYGRSVRLDGLSPTNTKIRERAVVYHGWDKVYEKNVIQGMSRGCITLDYAIKDSVIDKVKGGSLINFGYSKPTKSSLPRS